MQNSLIIIPTLNEIDNIEGIIRKVFDVNPDYHVLVVDDQSTDGTHEAVEKLKHTFEDKLFLESRKGKKGLGRAYLHGFKWALKRPYEYIVEMDADFSHNPEDLPKLLEACKNNDLAVGSRYIKGVNVVNWPMKRVLLSYCASKYVQFITGIPVNDTTAGFVAYKRGFLKALNLDKIMFVGYAFQIEMKYRAWINGFSIKEVSVIFTDRTQGESKMNGSIIKEAAFGVIKLALFKNRLKKQNEKNIN